MEVEQIIPQAEDGMKAKDVNNHEEPQLNGLSNGYERKKEHKSEHRDKDKERSHKSEHRDKDKDRSRSSGHKSEHRDKDRHRSDKDKHSSTSSSKDKKDKDRDKEKDKDRKSSSSKHDKEHKSSSKDKDKDKEKSRDKDKERKDKDKDRDRSHKDKSSSSSSKDKHHSSSSNEKKDKDHDKTKEREKDKIRSKDKEKDKHRHSSSHGSSSRDKDKDKSSSKDKHSDGKDKERSPDKHKSSHKDKHRDKDKDRHRHDKDREKSKHREDKDKREKVKEEKIDKEQNENEEMEFQIPKREPKEELHTYHEDENSIDDKLVIKDEEMDVADEYNSMDDTADTRLSEMHNTTLKTDQEDSDEDMPLAKRKPEARLSTKRKYAISEDEDDELPLASRKKLKKETKKKVKKEESEDEDFEADYDEDYDQKPQKGKKKKMSSDDDFEERKPKKKKKVKKEDSEDEDLDEKPKKKKKAKAAAVKEEAMSPNKSPTKRKKKEEEEQEVWKWWEEEKKDDGTKWKFLEHKGPVFAPAYEPLPKSVKFLYDGKEMKLSQDAEEVATFYARMLEHDYTSKQVFNDNFFHDWRDVMTKEEREKIRDLRKCNFKDMHKYFIEKSEERKAMSKEEKKAIKEQNEEVIKEYGFCQIDGHKEKIGNFKIEPPGLFRGRGEHPKMGKLKKRVNPEDIMINCSKDSVYPKPPPGRKWKEIRHDPTVTWLASWTENVQGQVKYIMLNPSSKLKGEKDWQKYETARRLAKSVDSIRQTYREDWKSKEMRIRQRAVALYFIDKLALRAGNEKDEDQADTVGCCSLRVEHIALHDKMDDKDYVVVFDFLGKDSIRYYNAVPVEKRVYKSLQLFIQDKQPGDDLFDRLNTAVMNKHLNELMEGLTAKVFRTFNASWTLQQQLNILTKAEDSVTEKILSYNRANRAVAILCNHQRAVPKTHEKSMENLKGKIEAKREAIVDGERQLKDAKRDAKHGSVKEKVIYEKKKKQLERLKEQLKKLEVNATDREENKEIALGTSKLNYLDPRISVAWCKKHDVPIEKIYNKTQRDKFRWAIDMAGPDYVF